MKNSTTLINDVLENELKEDFVSFRQAELLKSIGFPQSIFCGKYYDVSHILRYNTVPNDDLSTWGFQRFEMLCQCPNYDLVATWFRKVHNVFMDISYTGKRYAYCLKNTINNERISDNLGYFNEYEEAISAAIDESISIISKRQNLPDSINLDEKSVKEVITQTFLYILRNTPDLTSDKTIDDVYDFIRIGDA